MPRKQVGAIDADLLAEVDKRAEWLGQTRRVFIERAAEQALSGAKEPIPRTQADPGSVPSSEGVRSAAPARQPRHIPSSEATPANVAVAAPGVGVQLSEQETEQVERITEAEHAAHHQKRREAMRRGEAAQRALASKGRGSEDPGVSSPSLPAPAEQPRMAGRASLIADGLPRASSSQSKRDVRPIPKGGK